MLNHKRLNALYFSPVVSRFIHHGPHLLCLSACYSLTCNMTSVSGRTRTEWLCSIQTHSLTLCIITIQKLNALLYKIIYAKNHYAHRQKYTVVFCKKKKKKERGEAVYLLISPGVVSFSRFSRDVTFKLFFLTFLGIHFNTLQLISGTVFLIMTELNLSNITF